MGRKPRRPIARPQPGTDRPGNVSAGSLSGAPDLGKERGRISSAPWGCMAAALPVNHRPRCGLGYQSRVFHFQFFYRLDASVSIRSSVFSPFRNMTARAISSRSANDDLSWPVSIWARRRPWTWGDQHPKGSAVQRQVKLAGRLDVQPSIVRCDDLGAVALDSQPAPCSDFRLPLGFSGLATGPRASSASSACGWSGYRSPSMTTAAGHCTGSRGADDRRRPLPPLPR